MAGNSSGLKVLFVAFAALGLFLAVILSGFLNPDDENPDGAGKKSADAGTAAPADLNALKFKSWPQPQAALLLSGEQHGYFEPCGCTENQSGGFSRRGDLLRQLQELNWQVAGLDAGGLVKRERLQSQLKFQTMLKALQDLNYKAIALGPEEIRLKPDYLLSQHEPDNADGVAMLAANVVFFESPELGTPATVRVFEVGGLKIGVTAVLGASWKIPLRHLEDATIQDPAVALPGALESLRAVSPDLLVLMCHGTLDEAKSLAKDFPDFDVMLSTGGAEDPDGQPIVVGETVLLNVGKKGKYTGVLGVYPDGDPRFRFELVQLDRQRFGDTPGMIEHMRYYQDELRERQIAIAEPAVGHPSGSAFVGSDACAECHDEAYDIWKKTSHSSAFESLDPSHKRHGYERLKGVPRMFDPECICCHVTGWHPQDVYRYRSGFINESLAASQEERDMSSRLLGVGCENCHGPGRRHIELVNDGEDELAAKEMRVTVEQARSSEGCYKCHDLDNSPTFDFDKYWPKIAH